jgi:hypothetical protein
MTQETGFLPKCAFNGVCEGVEAIEKAISYDTDPDSLQHAVVPVCKLFGHELYRQGLLTDESSDCPIEIMSRLNVADTRGVTVAIQDHFSILNILLGQGGTA